MSDTDLVTLLTDQAGRLFGDLIDRDLLAQAEHRAPATLVDAVDAFGLATALDVPEAEGGLRFADAGALFSLFGAHAVPLPIGETMLARAVLSRAG
jgi:acyl-CoA dehydrogenase